MIIESQQCNSADVEKPHNCKFTFDQNWTKILNMAEFQPARFADMRPKVAYCIVSCSAIDAGDSRTFSH